MSFMLCVVYALCYKQTHYPECHYAECHYGECRGTLNFTVKQIKLPLSNVGNLVCQIWVQCYKNTIVNYGGTLIFLGLKYCDKLPWYFKFDTRGLYYKTFCCRNCCRILISQSLPSTLI